MTNKPFPKFGLLVLSLLLVAFHTTAQDAGKILFFQTDWGNTLSWDAFCARAKASGFDGIDIWLPRNSEEREALKKALDKHGLQLNLMHGTDKSLPFEESLSQYKKRLYELGTWNPVLVNSQTGSDFFTMEQNAAFIKAAQEISEEIGVRVHHETHRGRFSYTLPLTLAYLRDLPEFTLTADISHWMVVHESLLEGREDDWKTIVARTEHIHARVGHAEGPQVNDPAAPEWEKALKRHLDIWEPIIKRHWMESDTPMTVTCEFGPPNYLPALPYSQQPVADQWKANVYIMKALKNRLQLSSD